MVHVDEKKFMYIHTYIQQIKMQGDINKLDTSITLRRKIIRLAANAHILYHIYSITIKLFFH